MSFPNATSKGKEKYISSASDWSPWKWDSKGYYTSYRTDSTGATEWTYQYPEPEPSIPRSPNYPSQDLSSHRANYGPDHGGNYLNSQNVQSSQELSPSSHTDSAPRTWGNQPVSVAAQYKITPQTNTHYSSWNSPASAGDPGPSSHSSVTGPSYNSVNPGTFSINHSLQKLNLNPGTSYSGGFPGGATQGPLGAADASSNTKLITRHGQTDQDTLDPRYRIVPSKQSKKFWRSGRVFMMLWSEPAGEKSGKAKAGTANNSHITYALHGGRVHTEIRRFVVVQDGYGCCLCLAIHTYSGKATLKPNLPNKERHAIIYTSKEPPPSHSEKNPDGTVVTEELSIDPIKVNGTTRDDGEGTLDPKSRLSFVKVYTVEKDVRICNIGIVHEKSMRILEYYSPVKMTIPPISPPSAPAPIIRQGLSREDSKSDEETAMEAEPRARTTVDVPRSSSGRESSKKYEQPGPSSSRRESHSGQQRPSRPRRHSVVQPASSSRKDKSPSREPGSSSKPEPKRRH